MNQPHDDEPPEDWGHEDCEVCNEARENKRQTVLAAAFRAGAEAMRETACTALDPNDRYDAACIIAIRAVPIPEPAKD